MNPRLRSQIRQRSGQRCEYCHMPESVAELRFQPTCGPKDERVLVLTNIKKNISKEPTDLAFFTANYTEQVTFHNAATGKKLAESSFFEPLTPNSLVVPGFGGRCYFPTRKGFITLQVMPANSAEKR